MDRFSHGVAEVTDVGIYYTENAAAVNFEKKSFASIAWFRAISLRQVHILGKIDGCKGGEELCRNKLRSKEMWTT